MKTFDKQVENFMKKTGKQGQNFRQKMVNKRRTSLLKIPADARMGATLIFNIIIRLVPRSISIVCMLQLAYRKWLISFGVANVHRRKDLVGIQNKTNFQMHWEITTEAVCDQFVQDENVKSSSQVKGSLSSQNSPCCFV